MTSLTVESLPVITQGIQALGEASVVAVLQAVQKFNAFTAENDPFGEHGPVRFTFRSPNPFMQHFVQRPRGFCHLGASGDDADYRSR